MPVFLQLSLNCLILKRVLSVVYNYVHIRILIICLFAVTSIVELSSKCQKKLLSGRQTNNPDFYFTNMEDSIHKPAQQIKSLRWHDQQTF